jgi:two-component system, sensor histidine kinase PdtaS
MKNKILFVLGLLCIMSCYAQEKYQKKIDSLLVVVTKCKTDTAKANKYDQVCMLYSRFDPVKMEFYNKRILEFAKKSKYKKGLARYYYYLHISEYLNGKNKESVAAIAKSKDLYFELKDNREYLFSCSMLAQAYLFDNDLQKAKKTILPNLKLALKEKEIDELGIMNTILSSIYLRQDSIQKSIYHSKQAVECFSKNKNENIISVYQNLVFVYIKLKEYKEAMNYVNLAIDNAPDNVSENVLKTNKNIIFNKLKSYNLAINEGLKINTFFKQNNLEDSMNYCENLMVLAESYYHIKKYNEALIHLNKVIVKPDLDLGIKVESLLYLSLSYLKNNELEKAKLYSDKAIENIESTDNETKIQIYLNRSELEQKLGNYKTALYYQVKQSEISEENNDIINREKLSDIQTKLDITLKNDRIKSLQLEKELKNKQIKAQRTYFYYTLMLLGLAIMITLIVIYAYKTIQKKNKLIELNNIELLNAQQISQKSLVEKETLLKEIHHRVKNNLQLVMSLLNIQAQSTNNNIEDFLAISQSRIISMALIHENLYQTEHLSNVNFKDYLKNLTESIVSSYQETVKHVELKIELEDIYFDIQTAIPLGLIINELVSNAYKYAFAKSQTGTILLKLVQNKDYFELIVSDNGIGMQKTSTTKKTLGLMLVEQLVNQINGIINIDHNIGLVYNIQFKNLAL